MELQQLLGQSVEGLGPQGLGTVAQGMGRVVVDLDQEAVGTGGHGAHGQGIHQPALAGGVAGVDDDGQVDPLAMGAVATGADGLLIEVHNDPAHALCDGPQSLKPEAFDKLARKLLKLHGFMQTVEE